MQKDSKKYLYTLLSLALIFAAWWILAQTRFKQTGIITTPADTLLIIGAEMKKKSFLKAIFGTLKNSLISFSISFAAACVLAVLAHFKKGVGNMINPFMVIFRSMPTMALVLILLLTVGSKMLPVVVAFLVVFPLCYENMRTAITEADNKLVTMARVFKVPLYRQITGIYLPSMLPYIFSSVIAGFGLNIKVIISAEVMGLPTMSIGYLMLSAKASFDMGTAFAWLVIAVILSLICETVLRITARLCMPYRYPDLKIIKRLLPNRQM